jgi:hypothetical protein
MIHPTDLVENQTVKAQLHLPMNPPSDESELPDTRKPRCKERIQGKAWILRGEITTTLLHNDSASMDCENEEEAKVQNTKSQTEAALGATFDILFGNKRPDVKYFIFFCNLVNILRARKIVEMLPRLYFSFRKMGALLCQKARRRITGRVIIRGMVNTENHCGNDGQWRHYV